MLDTTDARQRARQQREAITAEFEQAKRTILTAIGMLVSFFILLILSVGQFVHALVGVSNYFLVQALAWISTRELMRSYAVQVLEQGGQHGRL